MLVSGGSHWTSSSITIGYDATSTGNVTVTGNGSYISDSSSLTVGRNGTGTLTIADGALVTVGGTLSTGASGLIRLNDGLLAIKSAGLLSDVTIASTYNIDVYNGSTYVEGTADNLATIYFANATEWEASEYYAAYSTLSLNGYTLVYYEASSPVPEPSTYALFGGIAVLGFALRKRIKK